MLSHAIASASARSAKSRSLESANDAKTGVFREIDYVDNGVVACHNGSVPEWLHATCWNGHREARATMVRIYAPAPPTYTAYMVYTRYRWVGLGVGCQWIAGLVSRVGYPTKKSNFPKAAHFAAFS